MNFQIGDLIESIHALSISNDDGTKEESDSGELFLVLEQPDRLSGEYRIIRQKTLKISTWNNRIKYNLRKA